MTARSITDRALDMNDEIERFASFDHATRRFIAHAIWQVPELRPLVSDNTGVAGNPPLAFVHTGREAAERAAAYRAIPEIRACTARGAAGQRQRRLAFGLLLEPARVDIRWKRLTTFPAFMFCYERVMGPAWRQLLAPAFVEAFWQRRKKAPAHQLPLDPRLREDRAVPRSLENEPAPWYFPSLADADAIGDAPLLAGL
jgi:hypothetical protein